MKCCLWCGKEVGPVFVELQRFVYHPACWVKYQAEYHKTSPRYEPPDRR